MSIRSNVVARPGSGGIQRIAPLFSCGRRFFPPPTSPLDHDPSTPRRLAVRHRPRRHARAPPVPVAVGAGAGAAGSLSRAVTISLGVASCGNPRASQHGSTRRVPCAPAGARQGERGEHAASGTECDADPCNPPTSTPVDTTRLGLTRNGVVLAPAGGHRCCRPRRVLGGWPPARAACSA